MSFASLKTSLGFAPVTAGPVKQGFIPRQVLEDQLAYMKRPDCHYYQDLSDVDRGQHLRLLRQSIVHTLRVSELHQAKSPDFRRMRAPADESGFGTYIPGRKLSDPECFVYSCDEKMSVPGRVVLNDWDDDTAAGDKDAPQLRTWMRQYLDWLKEVAGLNSIDNKGYDLHFSIHYGRKYNNAFWDGTQMTTGDGDGVRFNPLHLDPSVSDHEIEHGVTEYEAGRDYTGSKRKGGLDYDKESGGINEHYSDAAAIFAGARRSGKTVEQMIREDWLIGAIAFVGNNKNGTKAALRSFLNELAYDLPEGKDSSIKHYRDYRTGTDVHFSSGIANHALYLAAQKIGGDINATLGPVWSKARRKLHATATFKEHYEATIEAAKELFPDRPEIVAAIAEAWKEVGVNVSGLTSSWYKIRSVVIQVSDIFSSFRNKG